MTWQKPNEGLLCITRGEKRRKWWPHDTFFCCFCLQQTVILCKQYHGTLTGEGFVEFVSSYFPQTFKRSKNPHGKLF